MSAFETLYKTYTRALDISPLTILGTRSTSSPGAAAAQAAGEAMSSQFEDGAGSELDGSSQKENGNNSQQPDSKKRKRNRQALNCNMCRARKVQCDRRRPACTACIKRGTAGECKWEDKGAEPTTQTFALETVVDSIRSHFEQRISQIERRLDIPITSTSENAARQAFLAAFNNTPGFASTSGGGSVIASDTPAPSRNNNTNLHSSWHDSDDNTTEEKEIEEHDEANGAAMALEVLAGGDFAKATNAASVDTSMTYGPIEKLPIKQYVFKSIVKKDFIDPAARRSRLNIPGQVTRRAVVNAIVSYLGNKQKADSLMDYYTGTVVIVAGSSWPKLIQYEHEAFWALLQTGETSFDPAWLADYCATLAISAAAQPDGLPDDIYAEDLYELSKAALELFDWRRKPSFRVVSCLSRYFVYMNFQNEWPAASINLVEAIKAAYALGYHQLDDDPSIAVSDVAFPPESLISRELPVQIIWDLVSQDWLGQSLGRESAVHPSHINTAMPRNFTDDQLEFGDLKTEPEGHDAYTISFPCWGKAEAARYTRAHIDLGKPPSGGPELDHFYTRLCKLEDEFMAHIRPGIKSMIAFGEDDWRCMMMRSGIGMKALHIHRPFMLRGYRDPEKFGRSASACVEAARTALAMIRRMAEIRAPMTAIWFLARQSLAAITTIYIDIFRDADIGIDPSLSDTKLSDIPYSVSLFRSLESNAAPSVKELGRKGQLLVMALDAAKEARRAKATGQKSSGGYGKVFRRIAADVEKCTVSNPSSCGSEQSPILPPNQVAAQSGDSRPSSNSTPTIGWLDDAETRNLLSSLGLINEEGEWRTSFTMNPALDPAANLIQNTSYQTSAQGMGGTLSSPLYDMRPPPLPPQNTALWNPGLPVNNMERMDGAFRALNNYSQYSL